MPSTNVDSGCQLVPEDSRDIDWGPNMPRMVAIDAPAARPGIEA
ncbi:MAG: hypothetical protein WDO24_21280 [Pseudomonadota bacterium]